MGHGAPRELATQQGPLTDLPDELAQRLEGALQKLDSLEPEFGQSRQDERHQQLSGAWMAKSNEIVEHLRTIGKVIVGSHQILTDMAQDGAGISATPWMEEGSNRLERLIIRNLSGPVRAETSKGVVLEAASMEDVDYAWLERAVVEWIVQDIETR